MKISEYYKLHSSRLTYYHRESEYVPYSTYYLNELPLKILLKKLFSYEKNTYSLNKKLFLCELLKREKLL